MRFLSYPRPPLQFPQGVNATCHLNYNYDLFISPLAQTARCMRMESIMTIIGLLYTKLAVLIIHMLISLCPEVCVCVCVDVGPKPLIFLPQGRSVYIGNGPKIDWRCNQFARFGTLLFCMLGLAFASNLTMQPSLGAAPKFEGAPIRSGGS